jgi:L-rhamnose isomerase
MIYSLVRITNYYQSWLKAISRRAEDDIISEDRRARWNRDHIVLLDDEVWGVGCVMS